MHIITILANLVRDPEVRFTGSGTAVANLTVAENRRRRSADVQGWANAEPTYLPDTVWGEHAEHLAQSLAAGARPVAAL